jgi:hypothetical protein
MNRRRRAKLSSGDAAEAHVFSLTPRLPVNTEQHCVGE